MDRGLIGDFLELVLNLLIEKLHQNCMRKNTQLRTMKANTTSETKWSRTRVLQTTFTESRKYIAMLMYSPLDPNNPYHAETLRLTKGLQNYQYLNEFMPEDPEEAAKVLQKNLNLKVTLDELKKRPVHSSLNPMMIDFVYSPTYMQYYNRANGFGKSLHDTINNR